MKRNLAAFSFLLLIAATAQAAGKKDHTWTKEPDSFMGISFSSNIVNDLPPCAPGVFGFDQKMMCYEKPLLPNYFSIEGHPDIGLAYHYKLNAKVKDGQVEYFSLSTNTVEFEKLVQIFTTKYGSPTSRSSEPVQTKGGVSLVNEQLTWSGKSKSIILEKYSGDINTTAAMISDVSKQQKSANEIKQKLNNGASKL